MSRSYEREEANKSVSASDTSDSVGVGAELIESKLIINQLKLDIQHLKSEITELKSKQSKFELELKRINDSNSKQVRAQQKKILFLMKRLLDLEDDEDVDNDEVSASNLKDTTFRF